MNACVIPGATRTLHAHTYTGTYTRTQTPQPHPNNNPPTATHYTPTRVAVERRVGGRVAHEREHRLADAVQRPRGAPRRLEDVEADLARLEVHVGVEDPGAEAHRGRHERVLLGHVDRELKGAALVRRLSRALFALFGGEGVCKAAGLLRGTRVSERDGERERERAKQQPRCDPCQHLHPSPLSNAAAAHPQQRAPQEDVALVRDESDARVDGAAAHRLFVLLSAGGEACEGERGGVDRWRDGGDAMGAAGGATAAADARVPSQQQQTLRRRCRAVAILLNAS